MDDSEILEILYKNFPKWLGAAEITNLASPNIYGRERDRFKSKLHSRLIRLAKQNKVRERYGVGHLEWKDLQ